MNGKVILGLSGGVDSSMSVKKLKDMGFEKIFAANHIVYKGVKSSSKEVLDRAADVCRRENIPFYIIDITESFADNVVSGFCDKYIQGETPNPCVICNEKIKFTLFYDRVREKLIREKALGEDEKLYYSTGHYVRLYEKEGRFYLRKAADKLKDQSYMLYRLPPAVLERCVFPMGDYLKTDITREAAAAGYSFDSVKESQDICFVEGDYSDFIYNHVDGIEPPGEGQILDTAGNLLGRHRGYVNYTIGQRKGLGLGSGPWYVISVDSVRNIVVAGRADEQGQESFTVDNLNWFFDADELFKDSSFRCSVKVRYNSPEKPCTVTRAAGAAGSVEVMLEEKTVITPGQSAVFYIDDLVAGGGIICRN